MTGKNLGFGALADIKPDNVTVEEGAVSDGKVDALAEKHGFRSREPLQKIVRRKESEPSANLNIRPPISTYNRFVQWAMDNRLSYPEALKELMDKAKI
jgi:hypothetical protein